MIGDLYIALVPKNRNKWRLKETALPSDKILFEGSRFECQRAKTKLNYERVQQARQKKSKKSNA